MLAWFFFRLRKRQDTAEQTRIKRGHTENQIMTYNNVKLAVQNAIYILHLCYTDKGV